MEIGINVGFKHAYSFSHEVHAIKFSALLKLVKKTYRNLKGSFMACDIDIFSPFGEIIFS